MAKPKKLGRCINTQEQVALLEECRKSRSRSLVVIVTMAIEACLRSSEIRFLRWRNLDLGRRVITAGESKTDAGEGREVPISRALFSTLAAWASNFRLVGSVILFFTRKNMANRKMVAQLRFTPSM